jgi:hypothetical protein
MAVISNYSNYVIRFDAKAPRDVFKNNVKMLADSSNRFWENHLAGKMNLKREQPIDITSLLIDLLYGLYES